MDDHSCHIPTTSRGLALPPILSLSVATLSSRSPGINSLPVPMIMYRNNSTTWVKGNGAAIGLTENEEALKRWMVAGPETARILHEYDEKHSKAKNDTGCPQEQILSVQNKFLDQVKAVTDVMQVFHWSRQAGNYTFLESWDQCLHGRLQVTGLLGRLGEISNMFDVSMTVADPCIRP